MNHFERTAAAKYLDEVRAIFEPFKEEALLAGKKPLKASLDYRRDKAMKSLFSHATEVISNFCASREFDSLEGISEHVSYATVISMVIELMVDEMFPKPTK